MSIILLLSYTLLTLILGLFFIKKSKTLRDYAIGSKSFTTPILFITLAASFIGGNSIINGIQQFFSNGLLDIYPFAGTVTASFIIAYALAPKMGAFMGKISIGDILETTYGKAGRLTGGCFSFLFCTVIFATQIGFLAYTLELFLNIPTFWSLLLGAGTLTLYSAIGGVRAVTITDVLQFAFFIIIIPLSLHLTIGHPDSSESWLSAIPNSHLKILPENNAISSHLSLFLLFCIPYLYPPIVQRILMSRSISQAKSIFNSLGIFLVVFYIMIGSLGIAIFMLNPEIAPKDAFSYLLNNVLSNPLLKNIVVLGIAAAIISTADSFLNSGSIAFVQDIIKPLQSKNSKRTDKDDLQLARLSTFLMGLFAILIALGPFESSSEITNLAFGFWIPTITIPLIGTILGLNATRKGFLASILAGGLATILWRFYPFNDGSINERFVGVLANSIVFSIFCYKNQAAWKKQPHGLPKIKFLRKLITFDFKKIRNYTPSFKNIILFAQNRANKHSPQYFTFGIFIVLNFSIPVFLWSYSVNNPGLALILRLFGALLAGLLMVKSAFSQDIQAKYFPLYWQLTILYCLPFLSTYMLLNSPASGWWLVNVGLALILGAILLDTLSFLIVNLLGGLLAYLFSSFLNGTPSISFNHEAFYLWIFCITMGLIFSRMRDSIYLKGELAKMKAMGATIAHEMRTPLSTSSSLAGALESILPKLSRGYEKAKDNNLLEMTEIIEPFHYRSSKKIPLILERSSRSALTNIDMLLCSIKGVDFNENQKKLSLQTCIKDALSEYPFQGEEEKNLVFVKKRRDFTIKANEDLFKYVLFNLLKNALYFIKAANKGEITIWTEDHGVYGELHFKDTSTGIAPEKLKDIFKRFVSNRKGGTGLGLWFCKQVMDSTKGNIRCESELGKYTHFILSFPKA